MSADLSTRLVHGLAGVLERRFSRRSVIGRTAVVGAAVAVGGLDFVLKPTPAYASVCGPGAACGDGWTAMCCTINDGVNQCPPGSFAGGWWKADSAGLCGGKARYYIDCQGECTHCGCSGSSFCNEGCWDCTRHCASGTCDERRVCWNVFRYGQCNQQIGCAGPVLCRMISCVPPWEFEACTTAAATDNNTTDHSAPCLSPWSSLQAQYAAMGGVHCSLGAEVGAEYAVAGGRAQNCTGGRLYQRSSGFFPVYGARVAALDAAGGIAALGLPNTVQQIAADGHSVKQYFDHGVIISRAGGGTFSVWGPIGSTYHQLGWELSPLGYPVANRVSAPSVIKQLFDRGEIVGSLYGTFGLWGPIYQQWVAAGAENGTYGLPKTGIHTRGGLTVCDFVGGSIGRGTAPRTLSH